MRDMEAALGSGTAGQNGSLVGEHAQVVVALWWRGARAAGESQEPEDEVYLFEGRFGRSLAVGNLNAM